MITRKAVVGIHSYSMIQYDTAYHYFSYLWKINMWNLIFMLTISEPLLSFSKQKNIEKNWTNRSKKKMDKYQVSTYKCISFFIHTVHKERVKKILHICWVLHAPLAWLFVWRHYIAWLFISLYILYLKSCKPAILCSFLRYPKDKQYFKTLFSKLCRRICL